MASNGIELLRKQHGMMARVAAELGVKRSAVSMWKIIPAERVPAVSRITGIPRHLLRPDLWEPPECPCGGEPLTVEAA